LPNFATFDLGSGNCNGRITKGGSIELVERKYAFYKMNMTTTIVLP
jgi:hypothetical protein